MKREEDDRKVDRHVKDDTLESVVISHRALREAANGPPANDRAANDDRNLLRGPRVHEQPVQWGEGEHQHDERDVPVGM